MRVGSQLAMGLLIAVAMSSVAMAQGRGRGRGFGRGPGPVQGHDRRHVEDHSVFQFLLANHDKITRKVTELPNGVETLTESDDPKIAAKIKEHVQWMEVRIKQGNPIRMRDPLFRELFEHADQIEIQSEDTRNGVRVIETSRDPYVVKLIKAHARTVSGFVQRGFAEAMKNHSVPSREQTSSDHAAITPAVQGYGKVVKLPQARHQPRSGTRICVDVTRGEDPETLNPAIEKVAKYVNIYRGAGKEPADVEIAVVLHGDATLVALNDEAYAKHFGTRTNPSFDCLRKLHEAGVKIYVCGQSLISKGGKPEEVIAFVEPAVSALTAVVNLQADGYRYVPLLK